MTRQATSRQTMPRLQRIPNLMPYPCSHFYFDIKFGNRLYSKEKSLASVTKIDIKVKVTTWIGHKGYLPGQANPLYEIITHKKDVVG